MNSYLYIKSFLGQEKTVVLFGRIESLVLQRKGKKDEEFVEEPKSIIHRPKEGTGNEPSFGERRTSNVNQLQKSKKTSPKDLRRNREVQGTIKAREKEIPIGTDHTHKSTGFPNGNLQPSTGCSIWTELFWSSQPRNRKG
ncbi:hypothetical protein O181_083504 [Austropuccinia psidii MF-1]|uniref:Uncharacterized protein n=1 Tax=Austropuccinia psidii MF-1 TaxID=1389203 RepID=A0A9Q3ILW0_9BASI|nr:hypothetical protein [Austropuccinia psidii MF-1]